jgi:hypothetical protein
VSGRVAEVMRFGRLPVACARVCRSQVAVRRDLAPVLFVPVWVGKVLGNGKDCREHVTPNASIIYTDDSDLQ